jgi:hypothetical protein
VGSPAWIHRGSPPLPASRHRAASVTRPSLPRRITRGNDGSLPHTSGSAPARKPPPQTRRTVGALARDRPPAQTVSTIRPAARFKIETLPSRYLCQSPVSGRRSSPLFGPDRLARTRRVEPGRGGLPDKSSQPRRLCGSSPTLSCSPASGGILRSRVRADHPNSRWHPDLTGAARGARRQV